ncbi:hypothetical protein HDU84_008546 [Entophlyctis sp. JEL0112]|nr:hypothetical protein HDU84_008546 [Entophlyctis sp. JEL0112]
MASSSSPASSSSSFSLPSRPPPPPPPPPPSGPVRKKRMRRHASDSGAVHSLDTEHTELAHRNLPRRPRANGTLDPAYQLASSARSLKSAPKQTSATRKLRNQHNKLAVNLDSPTLTHNLRRTRQRTAGDEKRRTETDTAYLANIDDGSSSKPSDNEDEITRPETENPLSSSNNCFEDIPDVTPSADSYSLSLNSGTPPSRNYHIHASSLHSAERIEISIDPEQVFESRRGSPDGPSIVTDLIETFHESRDHQTGIFANNTPVAQLTTELSDQKTLVSPVTPTTNSPNSSLHGENDIEIGSYYAMIGVDWPPAPFGVANQTSEGVHHNLDWSMSSEDICQHIVGSEHPSLDSIHNDEEPMITMQDRDDVSDFSHDEDFESTARIRREYSRQEGTHYADRETQTASMPARSPTEYHQHQQSEPATSRDPKSFPAMIAPNKVSTFRPYYTTASWRNACFLCGGTHIGGLLGNCEVGSSPTDVRIVQQMYSSLLYCSAGHLVTENLANTSASCECTEPAEKKQGRRIRLKFLDAVLTKAEEQMREEGMHVDERLKFSTIASKVPVPEKSR